MGSTEHSHVYRRDIDGLRAFAVIAVLLFHAYPDFLPGGFVGVDIFFVISGYLISGILLREIQSDTFTYTSFYFRRFRRILPALAVVLIFFLVWGFFILLPSEYEYLGRSSFFGSIFLANHHFSKNLDYFDLQNQVAPLLHLWSLAVEEQFYIIWPLAIMLAKRFKINWPIFLGLIFSLSFFHNISIIHTDSRYAFYMLPPRMWELCLGAILATLEMSKKTLPAKANGAVSVIGFGLITFSILWLNEKMPYPSLWTLPSTVGTFLIIAAGPTAFMNRQILANRFFVWIGLISYPLYLWHWPMLVFCRLLHLNSLMSLLLSFLFATATYYLLESPIKKHFPSPTQLQLSPLKFTAAVAVYLLAIAMGRVINKSDGFAELRPRYAAMKKDLTRPVDTDRACLDLTRRTEDKIFCRLADPKMTPTVALVGDSHANSLFAGFSEMYLEKQQNLILLGAPACPPFADAQFKSAYNPECHLRNQATFKYLVESSSIETVIITFKAADFIHWKFDGLEDNASHDQINAGIARELNTYIEKLKASKKRVVLVQDVPDMGISAHVCLNRGIASIDVNAVRCPVDVQVAKKSVDDFTNFYGQITSADCRFVAAPIFQQGDSYIMQKDGRLLYFDRDHLNAYGAKSVALFFEKSKCFIGR